MNKKLADSRFSLSARFTMLAVFLIASMILSVRFGSTNVPLSDILSEVSAFISTGRPAETASSMILWQIRIPRTIFAAFCGMGLSLCGLVLQTMTRNDLADPYVLGVSSGASTGAVIAIIWGWFSFFGNYNVSRRRIHRCSGIYDYRHYVCGKKHQSHSSYIGRHGRICSFFRTYHDDHLRSKT